ncbi:MAG: ATP-binding cassette domain-containing protein [Chloroflexi bacterium]|nr:ATP-binding cassette domain-containing protein [Chloroflexota bacterium]
MSAADAEILYTLENMAVEYGTRRVLEIPRLEIVQGEILGVIGPSGAGKSTLLRLLNFLEAPTLGAIAYGGVQFRSGMEMPLYLRRQVTMVFQRPILLSRSVEDNVAFGLRLRGELDARSKVRQALEDVGLDGLAHEPARTLSGGEAQRAALARALLIRPQALLLDEPTANLDPYNAGLIEKIILKLNRTEGTTIVMVTHNVHQARRLAHRTAFLLDGRLVELGETQRLFEATADSRTAAFLHGDTP